MTVDPNSSLPRLRVGSPVAEAAEYFRLDLERKRRPANTVDSYLYDLTILARLVPTKSINQVSSADIGRFLADANSTATRKRRLTSVRQFYRFLIQEAHVLSIDPTNDVFPNRIELREVRPLSVAEQSVLLDAAASDEPWSLVAIVLMMCVGLSRSEILTLERGQVDRSDPTTYRVQITSYDLRKPARNRTIEAGHPFPEVYEEFLHQVDPERLLFPIGFQAVNAMVDRVRKRAGLTRSVSPRLLRETCIGLRLARGETEDHILHDLGMAPDLRNRQSIRRFKPAYTQSPDSASN